MPSPFSRSAGARFATPLAMALLLLAGCDDPARVEPPQAVTLRTTSPTGTYLDAGTTLSLSVSATDASGAELAGRTFTWASSNPAAATVVDGIVTGVAPGTATISATTGGVTGQLQVTVETPATDLDVRPGDIVLGVGAAYPVTAQVLAPGSATPHSVHYATSAAGVVTVSPTGLMQAVGTGTATVTVRAGSLVKQVPVTVQPAYTLVVLGNLGGDESVAAALNEAGEVVGQAQKADGRWYPFIWKTGTMAALPTPANPDLGGFHSGAAYDINDAGTVVGQAAGHAVSWSHGVMTDLLPAVSEEFPFASRATGINTQGDVVGYTLLVEGRQVDGAVFVVRAGQLSWLVESEFPAAYVTAEAINDDGVVVGQRDYNGHHSRPVIIRDGTVSELFPGDTRSGYAYDVNASGQVAGAADLGHGGARRPYRWSLSGAGTDLGSIATGPDYAQGINDAGDVVGQLMGREGEVGFLWRGGRLMDLNGLVAGNGGWQIVAAMEINNRGQIAATAQNVQTGKRSAVLLNPPGL